jgi:hypothetical protein
VIDARRPTPARGDAWRTVAIGLIVAAAWFVAGLAVSRLLYEWRFPAWAALGRPGAALALGAGAALVGLWLWRRRGAAAAVAALPLLVNLLWLLDPSWRSGGASATTPGAGGGSARRSWPRRCCRSIC